MTEGEASYPEMLRAIAADGTREIGPNWRVHFRQMATLLDASYTLTDALDGHVRALHKVLITFGLTILGMTGVNFYLWTLLSECAEQVRP